MKKTNKVTFDMTQEWGSRIPDSSSSEDEDEDEDMVETSPRVIYKDAST